MASAAEQMAANLSWSAFSKATDLRARIFFTIGLLIIYRLGTYIPVPGIDADALRDFMERASQGIGGMLSGAMPFAHGGAFVQGRVMPFAKGGVVSQPTHFPMRGATGLMGEAGPEAIMPLRRGADGRLGVAAAAGGARPVNVTVNVSTPDVAGFQRSHAQIAAQLGRVMARGERNG